MNGGSRWHVVPTSARACWLSLLVGVIVTVSTTVRMVSAGEAAVLPVISLVLGVLVIALGTAGLVSPRLRGR
ncbi:hypothetical protein [Umezawaea sp.]|uniref:hypothetical protein n=1 Tax=Umezawaea sp. TaxID=1955258 RepID=UPI002ED042EE